MTECKHTLEEAMHMEDAEQITRQWANCRSAVPAWLRHWGFRRTGCSPPNQFIDRSVPCGETANAEKREMETSPTASGTP
ncbi:MAG: hypothetical protein ACLSFT_05325 [Ruminococcus callidus]